LNREAMINLIVNCLIQVAKIDDRAWLFMIGVGIYKRFFRYRWTRSLQWL